MHFNGLKISGALEELSIISQFWARPNTIQLDRPCFNTYSFKTCPLERETLKVKMAYAKDIFDFLNKKVKTIHNEYSLKIQMPCHR